jgi:hypothetical protein
LPAFPRLANTPVVMMSALAWALCLIVAHWQRARPEPLPPLDS